jgi:hypothetical protein
MISAEDCLKFADDCEAMAKELAPRGDSQSLLDLAARWRRLAAEVTEPAQTPSRH